MQQVLRSHAGSAGRAKIPRCDHCCAGSVDSMLPVQSPVRPEHLVMKMWIPTGGVRICEISSVPSG